MKKRQAINYQKTMTRMAVVIRITWTPRKKKMLKTLRHLQNTRLCFKSCNKNNQQQQHQQQNNNKLKILIETKMKERNNNKCKKYNYQFLSNINQNLKISLFYQGTFLISKILKTYFCGIFTIVPHLYKTFLIYL